MTRLVCYLLNNPLVATLLTSAALLIGAYSFEYIGGLEPCDLCWPQRYAHMTIFALSAGGLLLKNGLLSRLFAAATILAIGASTAVSGYHAGVEQKWWKGPTTCTSDGLTPATDMESMFDNMMEAKLVLCDEIPWEMFSISMAGYNFLISGALLIFLSAALFLSIRKNHA